MSRLYKAQYRNICTPISIYIYLALSITGSRFTIVILVLFILQREHQQSSDGYLAGYTHTHTRFFVFFFVAFFPADDAQKHPVRSILYTSDFPVMIACWVSSNMILV